ncbi:hypothetical protein [Streptomyces sparsus]
MTLVLVGCRSSAEPPTDDAVPRARELVDLRSRILDYTSELKPDGDYTPPDDEQRKQVARGVGRLLDGDAREAERLLSPLGLGTTRLTDTDTGRRYDEVAATGEGPSTGWGRLYVTADARLGWSAQVPHPVADRNTEDLGVELLEGNPGGALVLAAAHRRAGDDGAADVAHREDSAFHAVVVELQKRGVPGVQLHGFEDSDKRPYDAVVSTGAAESTVGEVVALADRMEGDGLRVCRAWSARCPLEGTKNVQGRDAQRQHATFVHLELAPHARDDGRHAKKAADALSGLLGTWAHD